MKKTLLLFSLLLLASCADKTANLTAATIETGTQTVVMTPAMAYMTLPRCTETITEFCGTKEIATKINDAQLAVEACLKTYRVALIAYKKSNTDGNAAAVAAALNAVETAKDSLAAILSLPSVKKALGG